MLGEAPVQPMIPVKDLEVARKFYEGPLGLERIGEMSAEAVVYRSAGGTSLCVYRSQFAGTNQGTAALWEVEDVEATVKELKDKGVSFERYDLPGLTLKGDVHEADGFQVAWFKDPDGNILSVQSRPDGG